MQTDTVTGKAKELTKMSEADLCLKLEGYFSDGEIYKEVPAAGGRCDMYIKRGCLWIAVEAKLQFSTLLINQALTNMPYAHYSFVAVPDLKGAYPAEQICRRLGIGVLKYRIHYTNMEQWQQVVAPAYRRKIIPFRVLDSMKQAVAGVQHNTMSDYKVTIANIVMRIERNGGRILISEIFEDKFHYSHTTSAKQCITKLCRNDKIPEFKIDGKYFVIDKK